jgi:hypothetical protein
VFFRKLLEGDEQAELNLPWRPERINTRADSDAIYIVPRGLGHADFDGDGKPDIMSTFLGDAYNAPNVTVLLNETVPNGAETRTKRRLGAGRR